ncbi:isopentenyl-diphosphate Delta-isomerase [Staphylococcus chromogenes]|nr:isopentenyl-diphosphate Delta-isomerase [Staphylococcus chromogenes]
MTTTPELVVLATEDGTPTGTAPKLTVHHANTPFHLAFSCYVRNESSELLLTRRALTKLTWPGVWTNSMCGHPGPGESNEQAIHRRAVQELGTRVAGITEILPEFSYRAVDSSGVVEWEFCPVYQATIDGPLDPQPEEVDSYAWVRPADLFAAVDATPFAFSPWMVEQLSHSALREALDRT